MIAVFAYLFCTIYYSEFKDKTNFFGNVLNSNYQQLTLFAQTGVGFYKTIVLFNYINIVEDLRATFCIWTALLSTMFSFGTIVPRVERKKILRRHNLYRWIQDGGGGHLEIQGRITRWHLIVCKSIIIHT